VTIGSDGPTMDEFGYLVRGEDKAAIKAAAKRLFPDVKKFADLAPAQLQAILDELAMHAQQADEDAGFVTTETETKYRSGQPVETDVRATVANGGIVLCGNTSTLPGSDATCTMDAGHGGAHRSGTRESW
jgi:hypothetical protein